MDKKNEQNYQFAGFSRFFRRSIDNPGSPVGTLSDLSRMATRHSREINFSQTPVSGMIADVMKVGERLHFDGNAGRISIYDDAGNEVGRIGAL